MKLAVIKTCGKQYLVSKNDEIKLEKLNGDVGEKIIFDEVLLVGAKPLKIGAPLVKGAKVEAEILEQARHKKVVVFKFKAKKRYKKKAGHRQYYTKVRILKI